MLTSSSWAIRYSFAYGLRKSISSKLKRELRLLHSRAGSPCAADASPPSLRAIRGCGGSGCPIGTDPKHILELALAPVGRFIDAGRGRDLGIAAIDRDSQLDGRVPGQRGELINDMEARRWLRASNRLAVMAESSSKSYLSRRRVSASMMSSGFTKTCTSSRNSSNEVLNFSCRA